MLKALLLLLLLPASTFADSLVSAHITADWANLAYTTTGSLRGTAQNTLVSPVDEIDLFVELTTPDTNAFQVKSLQRQFWFTGEGSGSIVISVPYILSLTCTAESFATATISANSPQLTQVAIGCNEQREGVLTSTKVLNDPWWGPHVAFSVRGTVQAAARVPEASAFLLLALALPLLTLMRH